MATSNNFPRQENYPNSIYSDVYARADQLAGVNPGRPGRARTAMGSYPSRDYQSPYSDLYNYDTGLAATAAPSPTPLSTDLAQSFRDRYNDTEVTINPPPEQTETAYRSGPSEKVANISALVGTGLGILSFPGQMKTAKLQRESLRQDLATAREHNQRRRDSLASFNSGWKETSKGS